jgi:hypothetical protein
MALSLSAKDNIFANVVDAKGKRVGNIAYTEEETGVDRVELAPGFRYELAPRPVKEKERQTLFIAAESGAGKSYFVREYAKRYKKMFPKNEIFLISYLDSDETIDEFKEITRLNCFNEEFLDQCLDLDLEVEFGHSLVIFDDIDSIVNKKTHSKIYGLLNKMLRVGRHFNIGVAYVGHELYASNELKQILNESMTITFFPKFLNFKKLRYLLEEYFGLSKEQIQRVRNIRDRSVTYIKGSDKIILSDTNCFIL